MYVSEVVSITHLFCDFPVACQLWGCNDVFQGQSFVDFVESKLRASNPKQAVIMVARCMDGA